MTQSITLYLNDIGQVPLLTKDEEKQLALVIEDGRAAELQADTDGASPQLKRRIKAGAVAKDRFIRANLRLVVSIAKRYPVPHGMELLDLIQEGNLGLEHAVDKFDWRRGFKFSTYSTFWIRQSIGRALDQKGTGIRLPGDRAAGLRSALRVAGGDGDGLDPENAEMYRLTSVASLDKPVGDGDGMTLGEMVAGHALTPEDEMMATIERALLDEMLDELDPRSRSCVVARFGLDGGDRQPFHRIGEDLGVTGEAARRIVVRALQHLRRSADGILAAS